MAIKKGRPCYTLTGPSPSAPAQAPHLKARQVDRSGPKAGKEKTKRIRMNASLHYLLRSGKNSKLRYYAGAVCREMIPDAFRRKALVRELETCQALYDEAYVADRVDYYCKLSEPTPLAATATPLSQFRKRGNSSAYYFDSREIVSWFPTDLCWSYLFGDVRDIPPAPTIVKSRSLADNNANAVLLKLNKNRHFVFVNDRIPFEDKEDRAIFRGQVGTRENRIRFVRQFASHPRVDAANTLASGGLLADNPDGNAIASRLSLYDHLHYRYIMALEGNDVASNLKWVMSSNSLAVMPKPTCETWFMEGRLQAGVHYVEVRPDFADLVEKMDYYSSHPEAARAILSAAQSYVSQFRDSRRERYIGLRVMQKYFRLTNP